MSFLGEPSSEPSRGGAGAAPAGYPSTPKDPRGDVGTLFARPRMRSARDRTLLVVG
jgi:hypothetical protein